MVPEILMHVAAHAVQIHSKHTDLEQRRAELRALEVQLDHQYDQAQLQATNARELIRSLIDGRVSVVQEGFKETLTVLKDQADHYMREQSALQEARRKAPSPRIRQEYSASILDIDEKLTDIRSQAIALYQELNKTVLLIGGTMPSLGNDFRRTLLLS